MTVAPEKPTVAVSNLPQTITVLDLRHFLESQLGNDSIFALEISTERKQWKPRSFGRIQFTTLEAKLKAMAVPLTFESHTLRLSETTYDDIVVRPVEPKHRLDNCVLHAGFFVRECCMSVLESRDGRVLGSGLCPRDKGSSSGCGKVRSVIDSRLCFMMFWRLFGVVLLMGMPMPWS